MVQKNLQKSLLNIEKKEQSMKKLLPCVLKIFLTLIVFPLNKYNQNFHSINLHIEFYISTLTHI